MSDVRDGRALKNSESQVSYIAIYERMQTNCLALSSLQIILRKLNLLKVQHVIDMSNEKRQGRQLFLLACRNWFAMLEVVFRVASYEAEEMIKNKSVHICVGVMEDELFEVERRVDMLSKALQEATHERDAMRESLCKLQSAVASPTNE